MKLGVRRGMLAADVEHNLVRAILAPLDSLDDSPVRSAIDALREEGLRDLRREGLTVRFVTPTHGTRSIKDAMARDVMNAFEDAGIRIAAARTDIVGFPALEPYP